jgi:hypothetical protein
VDRLGVRVEYSYTGIDEQLCLCLEALWIRFSPDQRCHHRRQNLAYRGYLVDHLGNRRRRGRVGPAGTTSASTTPVAGLPVAAWLIPRRWDRHRVSPAHREPIVAEVDKKVTEGARVVHGYPAQPLPRDAQRFVPQGAAGIEAA